MARKGCQACGALPSPGRNLHVDHLHVRGWRHMPPSERRQYVRGVLDWKCNSVLKVGVTAARLRQLANYLARYDKRAAKETA
jgi:Recombination endonuclease VII